MKKIELQNKINKNKRITEESFDKIKERLDEVEIEVGIQKEKEDKYENNLFYMSPFSVGYAVGKKLHKEVSELKEDFDLLIKYLKIEKTERKETTNYNKKRTKK